MWWLLFKSILGFGELNDFLIITLYCHQSYAEIQYIVYSEGQGLMYIFLVSFKMSLAINRRTAVVSFLFSILHHVHPSDKFC